MKVSQPWLQTYFEDKIPTPAKLGELFTFHSFEVEGIEGDVLDVKILPDRAHYCLSHQGIAEEVSALTGLRMIPLEYQDKVDSSKKVPVEILAPDFCKRYVARYIENIEIKASSDELHQRLESIGSRSINNVVDATNFVMFDLGQPIHAFDADKVVGGIKIRKANEGEKITILDGREITLTAEDHVIADDEGPLAIAGVKGGKRAEVTTQTKRLIIEVANFNAGHVRKTSTRIGIRNDSSKRYENAITPEWAIEGMYRVSQLISEFSKWAKFSEINDIYPVKEPIRTIQIDPAYISKTLGIEVAKKTILDILYRLNIKTEENDEKLLLTIPPYRLDLNIPQDVVEEIGRLVGYDKVPEILPPPISTKPQPLPVFYISEKIKNLLVAAGFSEVMLYTLVSKGDVETAYPLASDKSALRTSLAQGLLKCLEMNAHNADLLGLDIIKIFEIGRTFTRDKKTGEVAESIKLGLGVAQIKKIKGVTSEKIAWEALERLSKELAFSAPKGQAASAGTFAALEIELSGIVESATIPETFDDLKFGPTKSVEYKSFSQYPFIVRDIAVFVLGEVSTETSDEQRDLVWKTIWKGVTDAKAEKLIARHGLFDVFSKTADDGIVKTSYAYRLILQSKEKTLTDNEANDLMQKIYSKITEKGWEVR